MRGLVQDPIVVLGAPRSGTTYLREILDSHPEVAMTNEVRLLEWLHRSLLQTGDDRALFAQREAFVGFLLDELPDLVRRYYRTLAPQARWWGDKNPHYAEDEGTLQTISTVFPGTRFIHIVRDPRAVIASLLSKRHDDGTPWIEAQAAHVLVGTHLGNASRFGLQHDQALFHEIRYEDLVADDVTMARELFDWLEIPFVAEVLEFCEAQSVARTGFSGPTSDLATVGDREAAKSHWASVIAPSDQRRSLQYLAPYLLKFGYETKESLDIAYQALPEGA